MPHPTYHCPVCGTSLPVDPSTLGCSTCHERYSIHRGIPELIAKHFLDSFKVQEQHFHDELSAATRRQSVIGRESEFHRHFKRPMLDLAPGSSILEIACGTRADGIELALAGQYVTALDLSVEAVERSRDLAASSGAGERLRFCVADAEHLPFAEAAFDASFVAASFHHFPNQAQALRELARVTRPGGLVIWGVEPASWPYTTIYRALAPVKRFIRRRRQRRHDSIADDTTRGYTERDIRALFTQAHLEVLEIRPVKLLTELYDSSVRLAGRLVRRDFQSTPAIDHGLAQADRALRHIPGLRRLFWHWNVIGRVPLRSSA